MKVFYSEDYVKTTFNFDTVRKSACIAASLNEDPIPGVEIAAPEPACPADLAEVHDPCYVDAVRTGAPRFLAESQGFDWDASLWASVIASTGGVVSAAKQALKDGASGTLSSGLHHAGPGAGSGFCTFNGLALAALAAHRETDGRVLILDLDAHCGGGTHEIVKNWPWVRCLDVSVNSFDSYRPEGANTLDIIRDEHAYLGTIERRLAECGTDFAICIYNAGMDPYEDNWIGGFPGINIGVLHRREEMVFTWCRNAGIPIAFTMAGGYKGPFLDMDGLVSLHRLTISASARI